MWNVFKSLLIKASQPVYGPEPKAPSTVIPQDQPKILPADRRNHVNKIHYDKPHEANIVVQRSKFQDPQRHKTLHYYACPVCHHELSQKKYIVGHDSLASRHD